MLTRLVCVTPTQNLDEVVIREALYKNDWNLIDTMKQLRLMAAEQKAQQAQKEEEERRRQAQEELEKAKQTAEEEAKARAEAKAREEAEAAAAEEKVRKSLLLAALACGV